MHAIRIWFKLRSPHSLRFEISYETFADVGRKILGKKIGSWITGGGERNSIALVARILSLDLFCDRQDVSLKIEALIGQQYCFLYGLRKILKWEIFLCFFNYKRWSFKFSRCIQLNIGPLGGRRRRKGGGQNWASYFMQNF